MFDWLLGRAWGMAKNAYANASSLGIASLPTVGWESGVDTGGGSGIEQFMTRYAGDEPAALVVAHDRALEREMKEVADRWAAEFQGAITSAMPVGPGFILAIEWLRKVVNGGDGLGYVGAGHRMAQGQGYKQTALARVGARGLPTPPGAALALTAVAGRESDVLLGVAADKIAADRLAEQHKLRVDAAEALIRARNDALDALMDHLFTQMHLMFDVFGRNNDYLVKLQRQENAIRSRLDIRLAELSGWEERIATTDDSKEAANRKLKAQVERYNTRTSMSAEAHIRMLKRFSSRAASALNSAGVSVSASASESNNVDSGV
ncbi:MAG: hypothetical protein WC322_00195 [Candidatus Paceibacterota bacterium]|jgi:hypothetical protein